MAVVAAVHGGYLPSKFRNSSAKLSNQRTPTPPPPRHPPPIYISTSRSHVNLFQLRELCTFCNYSFHRFPNIDPLKGQVEPVDIEKIRTALDHSSVVVSVFSKPEFVSFPSKTTTAATASSSEMFDFFTMGFNTGDLLRKVMPVTPANGRLVGFGRAVSDFGLTASIYDVMVVPSLRRRGIGLMIISKLLRMLTNRGVYDISAVCSEKERLFFKACGFGNDILGSTTMMYCSSGSSCSEGKQMVIHAGRKTLLVPPLRKPIQS